VASEHGLVSAGRSDHRWALSSRSQTDMESPGGRQRGAGAKVILIKLYYYDYTISIATVITMKDNFIIYILRYVLLPARSQADVETSS